MNAVTELRTALEGFAPIDLEELNAHASLLSRVDRKYALHADQAGEILAQLQDYSDQGDPVRVLEIAQTRAHTYASHYFDTPERDSFFTAAHRHRRRFKVRIRHYRDSNLAFVEVKTRGAWGRTVKERLPYPAELARLAYLNLPALVWVHEQLERASCEVDVSRLRPSLDGSFQRSTLLLPGAPTEVLTGSDAAREGICSRRGTQSPFPSRATIDTSLEWALPGHASREAKGSYRTPSLVIIETKSPSAPSILDRLLWARGIRPTRVSKYATALCVMRPELPQNRWHRTIVQHFPPPYPPLSPEGASNATSLNLHGGVASPNEAPLLGQPTAIAS